MLQKWKLMWKVNDQSFEDYSEDNFEESYEIVVAKVEKG